jgi:UDP-3-O-[3-hydroxymyristoyl] glucosamine N-acyltransferase
MSGVGFEDIMPDPRFFLAAGPLSLGHLAGLSGARIDAAAVDLPIARAAPLNRAVAGDIAFIADRRYLPDLKATGAAACFVPEALAGEVPPGCIAIVTAHPQAAWSMAAAILHLPITHGHQEPAIHPSAELEEGVVVGAGAVIGAGARIGRGTRLGPGVVIGPGVAIGRDGRIGARAVVGFALLGDGVTLSSGAVIGEPGFGAAAGPRGVVDVPQLGRAILQDNVTVGSNSCIDRGAYEDTVVGENTKIDNLAHIAHNARVGRNCLLAAYVGISGSATIGDGVAFGGRAGIADHVTVGAGASIGAGAGVIRDVPAGEIWSGYPGKPAREWLRETAWVTRAARRKG